MQEMQGNRQEKGEVLCRWRYRGLLHVNLVSQSVLKGGVGESRDSHMHVTCVSRDSVPQDFQSDSRGSFSLSPSPLQSP